jgi:cob(I)alamin adenosyltransferase
MSNYTKELDNGTTVIYGFNVKEGYFLKVYTPVDEVDNSKLEIMNMSTKLTNMSNEMLIELMTLYDLPESQIEQVALNNPIT